MMTHGKCLQVLSNYRMFIGKFLDGRTYMTTAWKMHYLRHIASMLPKMETFLNEGRREKFMRWLGFIQGAFWVLGIFSIDELRGHLKPDDEPFRESKDEKHNRNQGESQ